MGESFRRMLRREYVEICAGERERWSARAVTKASRFLHGDETVRRIILAEEIVAALANRHDDPAVSDGAIESIAESEPIRDLESRAWLLGHAVAELAQGVDADERLDLAATSPYDQMSEARRGMATALLGIDFGTGQSHTVLTQCERAPDGTILVREVVRLPDGAIVVHHPEDR